MNAVQSRWCLYTVCVCVLMHIWFVPALGGVHVAWHALSAWLNSDAVLGVSLSLHVTYTPHFQLNHHYRPIQSFDLLFLLPPSCNNNGLSSLGIFYPRSLCFSGFFWHTLFYSPSTYSWSPCTLTFSPYFTIHFNSKRWPFQCKVCPMHITNHSALSFSLILLFFF